MQSWSRHTLGPVREALASFAEWTRAVSKWWWAALSVLLAGEALALFIGQFRHFILWIVIAALEIGLMGASSPTASSDSARPRLARRRYRTSRPAAAPCCPPGRLSGHRPPQIVTKINETMAEVTLSSLQAMLLNHAHRYRSALRAARRECSPVPSLGWRTARLTYTGGPRAMSWIWLRQPLPIAKHGFQLRQASVVLL